MLVRARIESGLFGYGDLVELIPITAAFSSLFLKLYMYNWAVCFFFFLMKISYASEENYFKINYKIM